MNIVYATYPWAFETPGGGERQLLQYETALIAHGYNIERHDPWGSAQLSRADLVHFFSCMGGTAHFCGYVKDRGLPLVISASLWLSEETLHVYPIADIRHQLQMADAVVTNGDIESERLRTLLDLRATRFVTIRNGFDPVFATSEDPSLFRKHFDIEGPFLLNVANIEPRKNQLALVRSAQSLGLTLAVVGHIRDESYAHACFEAGGDTLRYLGPIDHYSPLLRSAYAACSVFCLPSTLETPGLAALEAAATGARLVVTAEGSTQEYFGNLAKYVNPFDEDDIAAKIDQALGAENSDALARHVSEHFTWSQAVRPLAMLYQDLTGGGSSQ